MGKNSNSGGKGVKGKGPQSADIANSAPEDHRKSEDYNLHPTTPDSTSPNEPMQTLQTWRDKLEYFLNMASELEKTSLPSKLDEALKQLKEAKQAISERDILLTTIEEKKTEIANLTHNTLTVINGFISRERKALETDIESRKKELDAAILENNRLIKLQQSICEEHETEKQQLLDTYHAELNTKISVLEAEHEQTVNQLKQKVQHYKQNWLDSEEEYKTETARKNLLAREKQKLERENEKLREESNYSKARIDGLIFRVDDQILINQYESLATAIINFAKKHVSPFDPNTVDIDTFPSAIASYTHIPLTGSPVSKAVRASWVVGYISSSFLKYLFQPFGHYLSRRDQESIIKLQHYSDHLAAQDPIREAIWRNSMIQAMEGCGEYGRAVGSVRLLTGRDKARDDLFSFELSQILPVLKPNHATVRKEIRAEFEQLINLAVETWSISRRNCDIIHASESVVWSPASDWDQHYQQYFDQHVEGVLIDSEVESIYSTEAESLITTSAEPAPPRLKYMIFPRIWRCSPNGPPVAIHEGMAMFSKSALWARGEEEYADERLRDLERQKLRRKKHFHHKRSSASGSTKTGANPNTDLVGNTEHAASISLSNPIPESHIARDFSGVEALETAISSSLPPSPPPFSMNDSTEGLVDTPAANDSAVSLQEGHNADSEEK
ncbi:hypothetical protein BDZ91DRAFT_803181 [Kalaharituber pfeilii]|nr:hypothetical protein BDZ91DRAFT_803181 [Kalaharituber pfeilii]